MQWYFNCDNCGYNNEVSEQRISKRVRAGEFRCRNCGGRHIDSRCWKCPNCGNYHEFRQAQSTRVNCGCGFKNKSNSYTATSNKTGGSFFKRILGILIFLTGVYLSIIALIDFSFTSMECIILFVGFAIAYIGSRMFRV